MRGEAALVPSVHSVVRTSPFSSIHSVPTSVQLVHASAKVERARRHSEVSIEMSIGASARAAENQAANL